MAKYKVGDKVRIVDHRTGPMNNFGKSHDDQRMPFVRILDGGRLRRKYRIRLVLG